MKTLGIICFLTTITMSFCFKNTLIQADNLMQQYSRIYNVDESHNHIHSRHVLHYAKEIMCHYHRPLKKKEIFFASLCASLHDIADHKYVDEKVGQKYLQDTLDALVLPCEKYILETMITNMSFSKTVRPTEESLLDFHLPEALDDFPFLESYHIARQADLLSSYNIKRTILYRLHKSKFKTIDEVHEEAKMLYSERMQKLLPSGFFSSGLFLAIPMASQSREKIRFTDSLHFQTFQDLVDYYCMDPTEDFEQTLDDLERLYENALE